MAVVPSLIGACREKPSPIIRRKVSLWRSMEFVFTMWSGAMADPCAASRQRKHDPGFPVGNSTTLPARGIKLAYNRDQPRLGVAVTSGSWKRFTWVMSSQALTVCTNLFLPGCRRQAWTPATVGPEYDGVEVLQLVSEPIVLRHTGIKRIPPFSVTGTGASDIE
jgi:hypothetical protein